MGKQPKKAPGVRALPAFDISESSQKLKGVKDALLIAMLYSL
jgi:hypothetical protein